MKKICYYFLFCVILSCSKDSANNPEQQAEEMEIEEPDTDGGTGTGGEPTNQAPDAFNLTSLENNTEDATRLPSLTWEAATDPENDPITYTVYLDTVNPPTSLYAEGITTTSIQVEPRLSLFTDYFWTLFVYYPKS